MIQQPEKVKTPVVQKKLMTQNKTIKFYPGLRVKVYWGGDNKWYSGMLGRFDSDRRKWKLNYDDGFQGWEQRQHIEKEDAQQK